MNDATIDILKQILVWLVPGILAITLHEVAHGWMALQLGDTTARDARRLTLNPVRHIDPVGTLVLPGALLLLHAPFLFGWAKPVPVNFAQLRYGRLGVVLVALAGPLANLIMMGLWWALASGLTAGLRKDVELSLPEFVAVEVAVSGVVINLVLMLFNLLPLPPLDGGRVLGALLPSSLARVYMKLERYGILILLVLMGTGAFGRLFQPVLSSVLGWMGVR